MTDCFFFKKAYIQDTLKSCFHNKQLLIFNVNVYVIVVLTGDLRLVNVVGETNTEEGRLEIYHNSTWGTVCNDLFGTSDAIVACRQLGYRYS